MSNNPAPLSLATPTARAAQAWAPVAPYVPTDRDCKNQRYFSRGASNASFALVSGMNDFTNLDKWFDRAATVEVYRNGKKDTVELSLEVRINGNSSETKVTCTAAELRAIADRLLDAAHDLDTYSANQLVELAA